MAKGIKKVNKQAYQFFKGNVGMMTGEKKYGDKVGWNMFKDDLMSNCPQVIPT